MEMFPQQAGASLLCVMTRPFRFKSLGTALTLLNLTKSSKVALFPVQIPKL